MEFNFQKVATRPGRDAYAGQKAAMRGLIGALNRQLPVFELTGHMPNAQSYNSNLGYELTSGGILPRGQAKPFVSQPWMKPGKPWTR